MMNKIVESKLIKLFLILSIGMYFILASFAFVISWVNTELHEEHLSWTRDSLLGNVIAIVVVILLTYFLAKTLNKTALKINMDIVAIVVAICMSLLSIWWIFSVNTSPVDDQRKVCYAASQINAGDYQMFDKGMYLAECPHQLGIVTVLRVLFLLFGDGNYRAYQVLSALSIALLVFSGYKIVSKLTNSDLAKMIYLILSISCLPIYFYSPYVYGEMISISCLLCGFWMLLEMMENIKIWHLIVFCFMIFFSLVVRKNSLIPIIAIFIVLGLRALLDRRKRYIVIISVAILGILGQSILIKSIYGSHMKEEAMPSILWVAMGTSDEWRHAGWYDGSNFRLFEENDCNARQATDEAIIVLKDFFDNCKENPKAGLNFYMRKITAQWEAPMYQAIVMNHNVDGEQGRLAEWVYTPEQSWKYLDMWMNIHQLIIFTSILIWLVSRWKTPGRIEQYCILIGIFGGFLFSIIWEAKSRYIFPYYVMMIPVAAMAIGMILDRTEK